MRRPAPVTIEVLNVRDGITLRVAQGKRCSDVPIASDALKGFGGYDTIDSTDLIRAIVAELRAALHAVQTDERSASVAT